MATPTENVQAIRNYWSKMATLDVARWRSATFVNPGQFRPYADAYYGAVRAMKELAKQASDNEFTRTSVFAGSSVFEQAMAVDLGTEQALLLLQTTDRVDAQIMREGDSAVRSLREIMLDAIWKAGTGGWFSPKDPKGVTSWLHSESVSAAGVASVLIADTSPGAVGALLRLVRDLALPVFWLEFLTNQRAFATLDSRLATTVWSGSQTADLGARVTIKALSAAAAGRVGSDLARLAQMRLSQVPMGNGMDAATTPPPPKPWYQRGELIAGSAIGIVSGAAVANSRK
jgi:hypothetical protein